jgi:hypothetical protein
MVAAAKLAYDKAVANQAKREARFPRKQPMVDV